MLWLGKKKEDPRFQHFHNVLAKSFANVKKDTASLQQWISFLHQKSQQQEQLTRQLQTELSYIPKRPEDIKRIVDSYYSYDHLLGKISMLNEKIDAIKEQKKSEPEVMHTPVSRPRESHPEAIRQIEERLQVLERQRQAAIREKVIKKITRNSKDYVKNLILSYIRKYGQIGALQLKDMIVEEQGLCSKSSFYRILDEIEQESDVCLVCV